jgi:hypothetical protein
MNFWSDGMENRIYVGVGIGYRFNLKPRKVEKDETFEKLNRYLKKEKMMNSRIKISICLLVAFILCSNAYAVSPGSLIKSPYNYVKKFLAQTGSRKKSRLLRPRPGRAVKMKKHNRSPRSMRCPQAR